MFIKNNVVYHKFELFLLFLLFFLFSWLFVLQSIGIMKFLPMDEKHTKQIERNLNCCLSSENSSLDSFRRNNMLKS